MSKPRLLLSKSSFSDLTESMPPLSPLGAASRYIVPSRLLKKLSELSMSPRASVEKMPSQVMKHIPRLLREAVDYLQDEGLQTEYLFRVSGSSEAVDKLMQAFERAVKEDDPALVLEREKANVHDVASLIKRFLMTQSEALISPAERERLLKLVTPDKSPETVALEVLSALGTIPDADRYCLVYVARFLRIVSKHSQTNKMTVEALAVVFGPILMKLEEGGAGATMDNIQDLITITQILIYNATELLAQQQE
jgi:hypothetical protein